MVLLALLILLLPLLLAVDLGLGWGSFLDLVFGGIFSLLFFYAVFVPLFLGDGDSLRLMPV